MKTQIALGAATAAAIALTTPGLASANVNCTFDPAAKTATLQMQTQFARIAPEPAGALMFGENANGGLEFCGGGGKVATLANTDKVIVKGTPGFEEVELNEGMRTFAGGATPEPTGRSSLNISAFTGTGGDVLTVKGTPFADAMSAYGSSIGGQVDLDNDGDTDVTMTAPARITLHGGLNGDDRLAAMSVFGSPALLPVTLDGGDGNDTLFGGNANDLLLGGNGDDFMNSVGGGADVVAGLDGSDTAFVDTADTVNGVESKTFKVGELSGSKKPLRGTEVQLPLAWTHPKAWKQLKTIEALVFDGAKQIGTVELTPAGKTSASGKVSVTGAKIGHRGKTVTAALSLKFAGSLKGHTLSIDIAATDRLGHRQVERAARSVRA